MNTTRQIKKKSHVYGVDLKPVKVYFDDLERIVEILRDVSSDISVSTDEYELGDITDLLSLNQLAIHELEISSKNPHVVLQLRASGARVYASDSTPICIGVVEKIRKQLKPRSRKLGWLISSFLPFMLTFMFPVGAFCFGLGWSISSVQSMNVRGVIGGILISILSAVTVGWFGRLFTKTYSTIYLRPKKEMPSFFARKKDDIALAIISGLLGAILGALGALTINHFAAK